MFIFEPTQDLELVRHLITHPSIWPEVTDDFSGNPEDFVPFNHPLILHLLVKDEQSQLMGMWRFTAHNTVCWEVHTCILPEHRGRKAIHAGREALHWIWTNTRCLRLITNVPEHNRKALWFAKQCGLELIGVNTKSFMKHGILEDQSILGISKPEVS